MPTALLLASALCTAVYWARAGLGDGFLPLGGAACRRGAAVVAAGRRRARPRAPRARLREGRDDPRGEPARAAARARARARPRQDLARAARPRDRGGRGGDHRVSLVRAREED